MEDHLESDVLIGDQRGIDAMDKGIDEISVGYEFLISPLTTGVADFETIGGMRINHAALVEKGRAGSEIRIHDEEGADDMTPEERKQMVDETTQAVVAALKGKDATPEAVAKAVTDAIAPLTEKVSTMEKNAADAAAATAEEKRKTEDEARATTLQSETLAIERKRVAVRDAALPLIDESKREALKDSPIRDILEVAVGDSIENPKDATDDYLRGVVDMLVANRARVRTPGMVTNVQSTDFDEPRQKYIDSLNPPKDGDNKK